MTEAGKDLKTVFNSSMLNVLTYLENLDDVCGIDCKLSIGASNADILNWEKKNMPYKLPNDLKLMFSLFNGFNLKWKVNTGLQLLDIGYMNVNKIDNVIRIPVEGGNASGNGSDNAFDAATSAGFLIDSHTVHGQIILLYKSKCELSSSTGANNASCASTGTKAIASSNSSLHVLNLDSPEIWLQDTSSKFHYLTYNFTSFLRLMVMHLGIVGWPLVFTPYGITPSTYQWMNIYCKERLILDIHWLDNNNKQLNNFGKYENKLAESNNVEGAL